MENNHHREEEGKAWDGREGGTRREEGRVEEKRVGEEKGQSSVRP